MSTQKQAGAFDRPSLSPPHDNRDVQRDAIKKSHQATSLQNKIALEADKMRKELAKNARKTQKGERKSGRG